MLKIYTFLLIGVCISSSSSILIRLAGDVPFAVIAFYRLFISMVVLLLFHTAWRKQKIKALFRFHWHYMLAGLFLAGHFISWIASLQMTSIANSIFLESTHPLFAVLLSILFLKEFPRGTSLPLFLLAALGMLIIVYGDLSLSLERIWGDILAILSALFLALYLLIARIHREDSDLIKYLIYVYGAASACCLVYLLIVEDRLIGYAPVSWAMIVLLALGPNLLGHSLLNWASRHLEIYKVNLTLLLEPILATLAGMIIISEFPIGQFYWGAGLILFSLGLYIFMENRP